MLLFLFAVPSYLLAFLIVLQSTFDALQENTFLCSYFGSKQVPLLLKTFSLNLKKYSRIKKKKIDYLPLNLLP